MWVSHSVVVIVEVDFLWKRTVDSLKTSFHPLLWTSSGLKDSPIHHHNNQTNHPINHNNFKIIRREGHHLSRYIKESIFIRVNNPTLNNNVGKFNLPHIWDRVLIIFQA